MATLPPDYVNGNILTAEELNLQKNARDGDLLPIDPTTFNENNELQDLGSDIFRWKGGHFKSTDDIFIGGLSLTTILEGNRMDTMASELVLNNSFTNTNTLINSNFTKNSQDKILRVAIGARTVDVGSNIKAIKIDIGGGTIVRTYNTMTNEVSTPTAFKSLYGEDTMKHFWMDWFDISALSNGSINVTVTSDPVDGTGRMYGNVYIYRNGF